MNTHWDQTHGKDYFYPLCKLVFNQIWQYNLPRGGEILLSTRAHMRDHCDWSTVVEGVCSKECCSSYV